MKKNKQSIGIFDSGLGGLTVLKKLQEIAETKPELVKDAVESVEKTNPKEVKENAVESETPIKTMKKAMVKKNKNKIIFTFQSKSFLQQQVRSIGYHFVE